MELEWKGNGSVLFHARHTMPNEDLIGIEIESMISGGWHWRLWRLRNPSQDRTGWAATLDAARANAEAAARSIAHSTVPQLSNHTHETTVRAAAAE